jgi:hypothetical protein
MHRITTALIGLLALGACATTPTDRTNFLDQPVEVLVARYGPPDTVLDMPDGRRQYQWSMRQTETLDSGQMIRETCRYSIYARRSDAANDWLLMSQRPFVRCP